MKFYKFEAQYIIKAKSIFEACQKLMKKLIDGQGNNPDRFELTYCYNPEFELNADYNMQPGFKVRYRNDYEYNLASFFVEEIDVEQEVINI